MVLHQFGTEFGYAVKQTQQAYRSRMDAALAPFDLSTPQYVVLNALDRLVRASNADLARACFVTPQTMHGIISGLQRRTLIRRPAAADTGRALVAELTDDGRAVLADASQVVFVLDRTAVEGVPPAELLAALDVLRRVTENLGHAATV